MRETDAQESAEAQWLLGALLGAFIFVVGCCSVWCEPFPPMGAQEPQQPVYVGPFGPTPAEVERDRLNAACKGRKTLERIACETALDR